MTAGDNVGLGGAIVYFSFGDDSWDPRVMEVVSEWPSGNVLYSYIIDVPNDAVGNISYYLEVLDLYGNVLRTYPEIVRVVDDDDPIIIADGTREKAFLGAPFDFIVTVSDNVGVGTVEAEYALGDLDPVTLAMTRGLEGAYTHSIDIPVDGTEPLLYRFIVADAAGNEINSTPREVHLVDEIPPQIINTSWDPPLKGTDVRIILIATDNVGVTRANLTHWFGTEDNSTKEMDRDLEALLTVPRWVMGDLHLVFSVWDAAGNIIISEELLVPLLNSKPVVGPIPRWNITEEQEAILDLEPYLYDANDGLTSLRVDCSDDNVTISGFLLYAIYDVAYPDCTIDLTVSDGEDETEYQLTVFIANVNDAPSIRTITPDDGMRFYEGRSIRFEVVATDEDGDDLEITWMASGVLLGTGTSVEYEKLRPGTHVVTITVSDGEAITDGEITVVIQEEEKGPWFGLVVVMVAISFGLALIYIKRRTSE
jgi:hypothetical protein